MTHTQYPTSSERLLADWATALSAHDLEGFLSLFTDDVVYEDVTFGVVNHGKEELRAFIKGAFDGFPDLKFELNCQFRAGDWAGMEWTWTGSQASLPGMPTTNKPYSVRGATIIELDAGKIKRNTDYWDLAILLKQVGLMPAG